MKPTTKIFLLDAFLLPFSLIVFYVYKFIVPSILALEFSEIKSPFTFFTRRGVREKPTSFNFIFSDLDIGIVAPTEESEKIRNIYYKLKSKFIFLGELELFSPDEYKDYQAMPLKAFDLYEKIRIVRQLNWLLARTINENNRSDYHKLKDIRKINQISRLLNLKSPEETIDYLYSTLKEYTKSEFVFTVDDLDIHETIFFDYLFTTFHITKKNQSQLLYILSCLPPLERKNTVLDSALKSLRFKNPNVEEAFLQLNRIEYIVASGFIRGSRSNETWHEPWLSKLKAGFKEERDVPYCKDPFENNRITSEGDVFLCCFQRRQPAGNLLNDSLEEIRNSRNVGEIRESIMRGEFHKSCQIQACPRTFSERYATKEKNEQALIPMRRLEIDPPNSHCNIGGKKPSVQEPACIMCERSLEGYRFEKDLSANVLKKINADHFNCIHIQGVSEPFFHNLIFDYLKEINFKNNPNQAITTVSNGTVFDSEKQKRWISMIHRSFIGFSIDAGTSETYRKIRRLDAYELVLKNIRNYANLIKDLPNNHRFRIQNNINILNVHEVTTMVEFAKEVNAYEIEFNLTGGYPEEILINKNNEHLFIEAQEKILLISNQIVQKVNFARPLSL